MLRQSILFSLAEHSIGSFCYLPSTIEPKSIKLHFRRGLQNVFYDNRSESLSHLDDIEIELSILDSLLYSRGPSNGLIIIFDMRNIGMRHLLRPRLETLKMFFHYLQDALPAKLEAMHVINCVSFFDMVLTLVKPFMKSEIIQKVRKHFFNVANVANSEHFRCTCTMDRIMRSSTKKSCRPHVYRRA